MGITQLICIIHNLSLEAESGGCQDNGEGVRKRDGSARSVYSRALSTRPGFGHPNQMTDSHSVFRDLCENARSTLA